MGKPKVCIDSGHYGKYNRCPGNSAYYESEVMWKLHLLQKKYLEQLGVEVITTRKELAKDLALQTRGKTAKGCDLFISDHSNAVGSGMNESVDYVAVYHLVDDNTTKCDDLSKEIGRKLADVIADVMGTKQGGRIVTRKSDGDRNGDGIMNDNYYGVLHGARLVDVPGLILEHSFHTNSTTVKWLLNDDNIDKLAKVEAECIASWLFDKSVELPSEPTEPVEPSKVTWYRVRKTWADAKSQKGAYKSLANAKACADKNPGYEVYDDNGNVVYAGKQTETKKEEFKPYMVKVTTSVLNIRKGAGTNYGTNGAIRDMGVYTIVAESEGKGAKKWGKLKSGAGWISLDFTKRV